MKNKNILIVAVVGSFVASLFSSCSQRIGDLTMMSNRNIEFTKKHIELKRSVSGKSYRGMILGIPLGVPNMEEAIDNCIREQGRGEYLKNATVTTYRRWYVVFGTTGIRVDGDLMGYGDQVETANASTTPSVLDIQAKEPVKIVTASVNGFSCGDTVEWNWRGSHTGTIIKLVDNIECRVMDEKNRNISINYSALKRVGK